MNYDFIVRVVGGEGFLPVTRDNQGFGYLPIIKDEHGKEVYRGEFRQSAEEALEDCVEALEALEALEDCVNRMPRICD